MGQTAGQRFCLFSVSSLWCTSQYSSKAQFEQIEQNRPKTGFDCTVSVRPTLMDILYVEQVCESIVIMTQLSHRDDLPKNSQNPNLPLPQLNFLATTDGWDRFSGGFRFTLRFKSRVFSREVSWGLK